ncbi:MAG: M24 family metallopeptidase [Solirubrobacteraceae bacterium]
MSWPRDEAKLERVRELMAAQDLDALVVRAPDNVLYLTNYWCMKGYDAAVFPREGEPTLIALAPQEQEARETAWTGDVRTFAGYHESDPRPPQARSLERCLEVLRERDLGRRVGLELSQGTQAVDRMAGEPTTFSQNWFGGFAHDAGEVVDASGLIAQARMIKTDQEVERIRLAGELAKLAMEHVVQRVRPGMREAEVGALFEGFVHATGIGYRDKVRYARAFTLVWSGPGIRTFTATGHRPVCEHEPTLLEIWVVVDGYWIDLTKNLCPGRLEARYERLLEQLLAVQAEAVDLARDGGPLSEIDRTIRARLSEAGYPGQPSHPVCHGVGARAHEPPFSHVAGDGEIRERMVLSIEPGVYWEGGGGLRVEDCHLVGPPGSPAEMLCGYPDDFRTPSQEASR